MDLNTNIYSNYSYNIIETLNRLFKKKDYFKQKKSISYSIVKIALKKNPVDKIL